MNNGRKWKLGYLQGGDLKSYDSSFRNLITRLAELGWLEPVDWSELPPRSNVREAWNFLARNMHSKYLRIETEHFWSADWNRDRRKIIRKQVLPALRKKKVDLMLAMGIWAGHDLANNLHSTPTVYFGPSFSVEKSFQHDPAVYGHIYLPRHSDFILRQVRLFKRITDFKTLGVVYVGTEEGRFLANLELLKRISRTENFSLVTIKISPYTSFISGQNLQDYIDAHKKISSLADAMWITSWFMNNPVTARRLLAPLVARKIPTWYPHGEHGIVNGAVFGLIHNPRIQARRYADVIVQIFHGVKPTSLIADLPVDNQLVMNYAAASKIGFNVPGNLLAAAHKAYLTINTGEDKE
ncbi:MAG: ABC transporter substrate binding protein [Victivallaceae bacterium]|nr:ABC transporter substrate binding protein [Victivallaceae bacterium]